MGMDYKTASGEQGEVNQHQYSGLCPYSDSALRLNMFCMLVASGENPHKALKVKAAL